MFASIGSSCPELLTRVVLDLPDPDFLVEPDRDRCGVVLATLLTRVVLDLPDPDFLVEPDRPVVLDLPDPDRGKRCEGLALLLTGRVVLDPDVMLRTNAEKAVS